jgi:hypothetical protein
MNWEAIGIIGELVGAIAVVITLVYLAIQTRLTRKAAEETSKYAAQEATHSAVGMYSLWRNSILGNSDVAEVIAKAKEDEELTGKEKVLYSAVFEELFFAAVTSFRSGQQAASAHTESIDVTHIQAVLSANPKALPEWNRNRRYLEKISSEFVKAVDHLLENESNA